jgi:hypothetical protein
VQLDVYLHGEGIGTAWARALPPGDTVSAIGPRGKLLLNLDADWHVLIGDETVCARDPCHALRYGPPRPRRYRGGQPRRVAAPGSVRSTSNNVDVGRTRLLRASRGSLGATT